MNLSILLSKAWETQNCHRADSTYKSRMCRGILRNADDEQQELENEKKNC